MRKAIASAGRQPERLGISKPQSSVGHRDRMQRALTGNHLVGNHGNNLHYAISKFGIQRSLVRGERFVLLRRDGVSKLFRDVMVDGDNHLVADADGVGVGGPNAIEGPATRAQPGSTRIGNAGTRAMNRAVAAWLGNANDVVTCISQGLSVAVHELRVDRIERSVLRVELSDHYRLRRNNCHEHVDVIDDPALPDGELRIWLERFEY